MPDLNRFIEAQNRTFDGFDAALGELSSTGKRRHWIWYVFPQLAGLGRSSMSRRYAIADASEAEAYLREATLRGRYLAITRVVADQMARGLSLERLMGSSVDAIKLVSSLTLFGRVARRMARLDGTEDCEAIAQQASYVLARAADQGYAECQYTMRFLRDAGFDTLEQSTRE